MKDRQWAEISALMKNGGIGVIPTDTLYGLVGSALLPEAVERIYRVRKRSPDKPFIVLISRIEDLNSFGIIPDTFLKEFLARNWPGKVSVIISGIKDQWNYLHRGERSIAFRLPDKKALVGLISETGPLVAPSANPEGLPPARTIEEARNYFGDSVDFYVNGGTLEGKPSTLVRFNQGEYNVVRQGKSLITPITP